MYMPLECFFTFLALASCAKAMLIWLPRLRLLVLYPARTTPLLRSPTLTGLALPLSTLTL